MVAREVSLQHMGKLADKIAGKKTDPPPLKPNQVQLYSYYKPGLQAGNYSILAEQNITSGSKTAPHGVENLRVYNRKNVDKKSTVPAEPLAQEFEVIAPQFSLDPKIVNSFYPTSGSQDEGRVLPHLVLNDPHFPWERRADALIAPLWDVDMNKEGQFLNSDVPQKIVKEEKAIRRNAVPWVRFSLLKDRTNGADFKRLRSWFLILKNWRHLSLKTFSKPTLRILQVEL